MYVRWARVETGGGLEVPTVLLISPGRVRVAG